MKEAEFLHNLILESSLFQTDTHLFCRVTVLKRGMFSCWKFLVVRPDTLSLVVNIDVNYSGAWPVIHLNFKVASRQDSCVFTGSQRRFLNTGEIIMVYFFTLQILRATKFWTYCKLRTFQAVRWMTIPTKSNTVCWKRARLLRFQVTH